MTHRESINEYGSIEIEYDLFKYRLSLEHMNTEDEYEVSKNIKRALNNIENNEHYLAPTQIEKVNASMVLYYNVNRLKQFYMIRSYSFSEQLEFFKSLVTLAKQENEQPILWDKMNFAIDDHEYKMYAFLYETTDLPIFQERESVLNEVKKLIVVSLTTLEDVIGKPKRVDFYNPDTNIIKFVETLLNKIDNLDDLLNYIETTQIEVDHETITGDSTENDSTTKKRKISLPSFANFSFGSKKKKQEAPPLTKKKKTSNAGVMIMGSVVIVIALLTTYGGSDDAASQSDGGDYDVSEVSEEAPESTKHDDVLLQAYQASMNGENEKAIELLESVGYDDLPQEDREALLNLYEQEEQYAKAIDYAPSRASKVINDLLVDNKTEQIVALQENIQKKNPYVDFEVAYINENWSKLLELKDEVELNGRKEEQITEAYIGLEQYQKGKTFVDKVGNPELISRMNSYINEE